MRDGKELRALAKRGKHRLVGAGHEGLAAEPVDQVEEGSAPAFIQMRGNFVEQQNWRVAGQVADEASMGEDKADQQCLLLAGRTTLRLHVLLEVAHQQIGPMRTIKRTPGGRVAITAFAQHLGIAVLEIDGGTIELPIEET